MTRKTLRNIIWAAAGVLAIAAVIYNLFHLWTAGLMFILGSIQMDDEREEGRR